METRAVSARRRRASTRETAKGRATIAWGSIQTRSTALNVCRNILVCSESQTKVIGLNIREVQLKPDSSSKRSRSNLPIPVPDFRELASSECANDKKKFSIPAGLITEKEDRPAIVGYDLDDSDAHFLRIRNKVRRAVGANTIREHLFEAMIEFIEVSRPLSVESVESEFSLVDVNIVKEVFEYWQEKSADRSLLQPTHLKGKYGADPHNPYVCFRDYSPPKKNASLKKNSKEQTVDAA